MALQDRTIAFIGGGHITSIIVENLIRSNKMAGRQLIVSDPDAGKLGSLQKEFAVRTADSNREALDAADFIFCNVLPQVVGTVINELKQQKISKEKVIISLAAGIPMKIYTALGENIPVVRALPNPPSQIGKGIAALAFNPHVSATQQKDVIALFASFGEVVILGEENINAITALSSPVTTHLFFQAIIDAAVRMGIDRKTSTKIAYHTVAGSMALWNARQVSPYELIGEASSPGGISTEILFALEKHAFKAIIGQALEAGRQKAAEFSRDRQLP
ncbi:MAG: pyrroline-5-carboxylate reductase [Desulfobacterales bacterium]|jgi:pyrroline-5-carboxylate reductase|nr:pyrroline-5-carboxylate reductase [Desulfobacterales bacterium]